MVYNDFIIDEIVIVFIKKTWDEPRKMKIIKVGNRFEASAVSLGCMRMGALDEKKIDCIIDTAVESGINF